MARSELRIVTVSRKSFVRDISAQGSVIAAVRPTLYASYEGNVDLKVKAGDQVVTGDLIAQIDSPELSNELEREQAGLNSLETNLQRQTIENKKLLLATQQAVDLAAVELTAAERELRRAERSWEYKVISRQDYEKATDDVEKARIGLNHARQAVQLDRESLGFELDTLRLERDRQQLQVNNLHRRIAALELRAPVNGVVGDLAVEPKAYVATNAPIATIIDLSALEVELSVADTYADDIAIGTPVSINYSGRTHTAHLVSVSPEVINSTVKARVRFDGEQPAGLRQNQRLSARLILESLNDVLVVDRGAFYDSGSGRIIYRIRDGIAQKTAISAGATSVGEIQIVDGLEAGDEVIISDINKFRGAERVLITR